MAMLAGLGHDVTPEGLDVRAVDWVKDLSYAAGATLLFLLSTFPTPKFGNPNTASFLPGPPGKHELKS